MTKPERNTVWRSRSDEHKIVVVRVTDARTMSVSFFRYDPKQNARLNSPRVLGIKPFLALYDPAPEFPKYVPDNPSPYPMMGSKRRPRPVTGAVSHGFPDPAAPDGVGAHVPPLRMRWELLRAAISQWVPEALDGDEIAAYSRLRPGDGALIGFAEKCMGAMTSHAWHTAHRAKSRFLELLEPAA